MKFFFIHKSLQLPYFEKVKSRDVFFRIENHLLRVYTYERRSKQKRCEQVVDNVITAFQIKYNWNLQATTPPASDRELLCSFILSHSN